LRADATAAERHWLKFARFGRGLRTALPARRSRLLKNGFMKSFCKRARLQSCRKQRKINRALVLASSPLRHFRSSSGFFRNL
jgi:hypothetical protein